MLRMLWIRRALNEEILLQRWLKNLGFNFGYGHMFGHNPGIVSRMLFLNSWQDELGDHTGLKGLPSQFCAISLPCVRCLNTWNTSIEDVCARIADWAIIIFGADLESCTLKQYSQSWCLIVRRDWMLELCNCRMAWEPESLEPRDLASRFGPEAVCYCFLKRLSLIKMNSDFSEVQRKTNFANTMG